MKDISNYEGLYAITSCGKVWSYRSKKFLKPIQEKNGYISVRLSKDGQPKGHYIHRLVAEAYIPNPEGLPQVDHIDEVKEHNWVGNLQWITPGDNVRRSVSDRKKTTVKSTKVRPIYCVELDRVFKSQRAACRELGLCSAALCWALHGQRQTTGGYHWRFADEEEKISPCN